MTRVDMRASPSSLGEEDILLISVQRPEGPPEHQGSDWSVGRDALPVFIRSAGIVQILLLIQFILPQSSQE